MEQEFVLPIKKRYRSQNNESPIEVPDILPNAIFDYTSYPKMLLNPHGVFEEIRVLGAGSYGLVILIRVKSNNKLYALKLINVMDWRSRNTPETFKTEVE